MSFRVGIDTGGIDTLRINPGAVKKEKGILKLRSWRW